MFKTKIFQKRYLSAGVIFAGLAIGLALLPEKYDNSQMQPQEVLLQLNDDTRFVSTDYVAEMLVNRDPSMQLIDVRSPDLFAKFSLPGAINIPLDNLLDKDEKGNFKYEAYLNQDIKQNIFYSNGSVYASQSWMITTRLNYKNNFVMQGGLNYWVETIMKPKEPKSSADDSEIALYSFRKAASMFFGGGGDVEPSNKKKSSSLPLPIKRKKKKTDDEGGC